MLDSLRQDLLYAIRIIQKQPGYASLVVFTLAIAIGGSTAIFSVVHGVLIRPLPYQDPERLVMVWNRYRKANMPRAHVSPPDFADRKRDSRTLENMAAIEETSVNLIGKGEPQRIQVARVSASFFRTLGVRPLIGRDFTTEEDQPGKNAVVVLSHRLWQREFGNEQGVLGKTINLSGTPHEIIGVAPKDFWFPQPEVDLWMPIAFTPEQLADTFRGNEYLSMIARIRADASLSAVQAEMSTIAANVMVRVPERREFLMNAGWDSIVIPLRDSIVGEVQPALMALMGAVTFLLFIGCANVANVILARAGSREKEIAVRAVLGATRGRLVRLVFAEALLLAIAGGVVGIVLAYWATALLPSIAPDNLPRIGDITIEKTVLLYSLLLSLFTGLLIGVFPGFRISLRRPYEMLKLEGTNTPAKSIHRFRSLLVIAEVALAIVLATGAALLARSFQQLIDVDPGFRTENRQVFTLSLPPLEYEEPTRISAFYQQLLQQIRALPVVVSAGANVSLPMQGHNQTATFAVEGEALQPGEPLPGFEYRVITPDYFETMGIRFYQGRDFDDRDVQGATRVAIIDQHLADRYWKNENPIGKRIGFSNATGVRWREIVGVVGHVKNAGLKEEGREQIYFPHAQLPEPMMTVVIHSNASAASVLAAIRERVKNLDANLPIYQTGTLDSVLDQSIAQPRFNMLLFVLFAATALALAAVGIYGVLSYSVTQRRKEIGIRLAIGAQPQNVRRMILRQSMSVSFAGILIGMIASYLLSRFLQSLLFRMQPFDPLIYLATAALAAFIALLASTLPARRASEVDPLLTLKE